MSCDAQHVEDVHNVLSDMQKTLECPICLDLIKEPVTTRCDHIFCRFCMLQLLSRKRKGRAQCPMCKKEVTKRSLQESPRFNLLIDAFMKIINAFELDSGYKFFSSQDHAKNILMTCKESLKKEEHIVVQSTGYRNRKRTINGEQCQGHTTLLETSMDTPLIKEAGNESCRRPKRKKQGTNDVKGKRPLITEFESDCSEDDLFKKAGSLGNDSVRSLLQSELIEDDDSRKSQDLKICDNISLKPETDEVVASDLAEYGFSEREIESTRSNVLCMEGARPLKETTAKRRSIEAQDNLIFDVDFAARQGEQSLLSDLAWNNDQAGSAVPLKKCVHDESQTLKTAIDNQYDKDVCVPEGMASPQSSSPKYTSNAVPRKRLKRSIQRVNEWLQKTSELLNAAPWDEELLSDVFPDLEDDVSDKSSSMSSETEIMTTLCPSDVPDAVENRTNVQDKIFGKVYKREKKANALPKITVIASVHVDGVADSGKTNVIPKRLRSGFQPEDFIRNVEVTEKSYTNNSDTLAAASGKKNVIPKQLKSGLQPEDFIKKVETIEAKSYTNDGDTLVANDILLNTPKNESNQDSMYVKNDTSIAQKTKLKTQNKSLKGKREHSISTRAVQSLSLVKGSDLSVNKHSPSHFVEMKINTYPSSNESGYEDSKKNVRRSSRLSQLSKKMASSSNQKLGGTSATLFKDINIACDDPNTEGQICTTVNEPEGKITTTVTPNATDVEIQHAHPEYETSQLTNVNECRNVSAVAVSNVLGAEDIDSEADTEHLMKAFKSVKRMSFKLDSITETDNKIYNLNLSNSKINLPNGYWTRVALIASDKQEHVIHTSDSTLSNEKSLNGAEVFEQKGNVQNSPVSGAEASTRLYMRFENKPPFSSEATLVSSSESTNMPIFGNQRLLNAGQLDVLNPGNETEPPKEINQERNFVESKSEVHALCSENDTAKPYPIITHQSTLARGGETRSVTTEGENSKVSKECKEKPSFLEEQVNKITPENRPQGSLADKLLVHLLSCSSSPVEICSDTPDGLLLSAARPGEEHSSCAAAEKSFVFVKEEKLGVPGSPRSPINESQLVQKKKRRAQKLESSEEESSEDEELPCFNALFGNVLNSAGVQNASSGFSAKQQGGGVLAMFSSCSTNGKTQTSLNFPRETLVGSQESVNLFSSQSNTSDHTTNVTIDQELIHNQSECLDKNCTRKDNTICSQGKEQMDYEIADHYEDSCKDHNLEETSECESEASHTGDFSCLSSQCDVFNTLQRDVLLNNLEKLQEEMSALEAVLQQHNTPNPSTEKKQASTTEFSTRRLQEACQKQTDHGADISPDAVPETGMQSLRSVEQPVEFDIGLRSPTPPLTPSQTKVRRETPEKVRSTFVLLKELKESALTQNETKNMEQPSECSPPTKEPAYVNPSAVTPQRSLSGTNPKNGAVKRMNSTEAKPQSQQGKTNNNRIKRSSSPIFTSPKRSTRSSASSKIPVVSNRKNFSMVASGLNQSEQLLVQKFAKKTQSIFSGEMSESTTHVVIKTDGYLVCERTLKYFLGIAGRKWVVSYDWIAQSFRDGRILDEYDFEVKGDVINGRNHRGPRRSRLGSDGLLLSDFEVCCLGSFKDMTRENLEWMLSLCGASLVREPQMFKHKEGTTSLMVVQPDGKTDYAAMRKRYHALVVTREWVLDSVASYKLQTFDNYLV